MADSEPHPHKGLQSIDITKLTNKQVHCVLNLKREGFDVVKKMDNDMLRSYFGEYSPSTNAYQTQCGEDELFHEVAKILLQIAFVSPRFHHMPKKRVGFIITTYEGESFDWGLLTADALREQLQGYRKENR